MPLGPPRAVKSELYPPTVTPPDQPLPLHRFLLIFVQNPIRALPRQAYEQEITVARSRSGRPMVAWVTSPELLEEILRADAESFGKTEAERRVFRPGLGNSVLTAEGASWRWQRRVLAPLFRHSEILSYVPAMAGAADELVARWRMAPSSRPRPIDLDMVDVTFTIISRTMLAGGEPAESAAIKEAGALYITAAPWEIALSILRLPRWVPHPLSWRLRRSAGRLRAAVGAIVARRRATAGPATDLLGRLLAARDPETKSPMTDDQLIDNLVTLLAAGHETTAKALTWTLYLLARAPDWQEAVRGEALRVAGTDPIAPQHIERLHVTTRVLKEALRLYPPAPVIARSPLRDMEIGGERLPAGLQIIVPLYAVHRHRQHWPDPDRFDPDRFLPAAEEKMARCQYMPFGAGPRICLGQSFAMVEAVVLLATFVRAAAFDWDGKHLPEPVSRVTLHPKGGMPLKVRPLDHSLDGEPQRRIA